MSQYDLTDFAWRIIEPMLPNRTRGIPRVDDLKALPRAGQGQSACLHGFPSRRHGIGRHSERPFRLAKDLGLEPVSFHVLLSGKRRGGIAVLDGGSDTMILGGHFAFTGARAEILLDAMPPVVHLREDADKAALRWALDRMRHELIEIRLGGALVAQHLAHMMRVQALRLYLAEGVGRSSVGWLFALAESRMAAALGAVHADPGARWTLEALAEREGMSRSSFAQTFKAAVGSSPNAYLTRWRMLLAGERLASGAEPVAAIALSLGYESESAFSTAFKRVMGCPPRRHAGCSPRMPSRRQVRPASGTHLI